MNLRSIEYFLKVAEEMNVTRAAEQLIISQQALSSHIKRLEDEYNVKLF
ncbi:MAG: LysR family transcriptional regulator, partial [Synergistaceae bacterium]|nr:LysR family transcriptional regulator [Synergistaceae bacterium]